MALLKKGHPGLALRSLLGIAWLCLAGAANLPARDFNGTEYLDLRTVAGRFGMQLSWTDKGRALHLESEWTRVGFEIHKREMILNGLRVHLGYPVTEHRGQLFLSKSDYQHHLQPILTPQIFGTPPSIRHVVIDAGHGGKDSGARNEALDLIEKSLTLDLARRLRKHLTEAGYHVSMTRDSDIFIPLEERSRIARAKGADVFLSLHFNATEKRDVSGVETYAFTPLLQPSTARADLHASDQTTYPGNTHDPWNVLLGFYVQRSLFEGLPTTDRGLKRARFTVLRDLEMPGILIEGGFVSHPEEGRNIGSAAYREQIASAIVGGLDRYRRTVDRLSKDPQ